MNEPREQLTSVEHVVEFWFGAGVDGENALTRRYARWFTSDAAFDAEINAGFATLVTAAGRGELDHFSSSARGSLALILLLDQFPRNIHRGTERAFSHDSHALRVCRDGIDRGFDPQLSQIERVFFYLPLEHAEDLACQQQCVDLFEQMLHDADGAFVEFARRNLAFAREHRDLIERFGRFPHRNAALGRYSTTDERAYLATVGKRFGQG